MKNYDNNKYTDTYRQRHPEKVKQWRINQYARFLVRQGWTVIPPVEVQKAE